MRPEAFKEGSEFPPCTPGLLRIYSMRFCPYAQRTLLVANLKGISYEVVNIDLQKKPSWYLEKNPEGKVPFLELDDKLLGESLVVSQYLDDAYPGEYSLTSADPYQKARDAMLLVKFENKVEKQIYACLPGMLSGDVDKIEEMFKSFEVLEEELASRGTPFFAGQRMGMVDLMIWPFLERVQDVLAPVPIPANRLPNLTAWIQRIKQEPVVQKTTMKTEFIKKFIQSYAQKNPDYDAGL